MKKRLVSFALALCMMLTQLPISAMAEEAGTSIGASGEIIAFAPLDKTEMSFTTGMAIEDLGLPESLTATVQTAALEREEKTVEIPLTWTSDPEYDMDTKGNYVFTPVIEGYTVSTELPEITVTLGAQSLMRALTATTNYGIWVGGIEVTSENASSVTGSCISGTVAYDATTKTLTLNNATITETNSYGFAIYRSSGDLKIDLIGSSSINISSVTNVDGDCFGIVVQDGKLSIQSSTTGGSLSIVSTATVRTSGNSSRNNVGILARGELTIEGCTVAVTAGSADAYYSICHGIEAIGLSINNAAVTANGGTWLSSSGINISYGINVIGGSLSIENSTVTANGGSSTYSESYGIRTASNVNTTISASTVTATGNNCALNFSKVPTAIGLAATASTDKTGNGGAPVTFAGNVYGQNNTYKYVQISPATPTSQARWGVAQSDGTAPSTWTEGTLAEAISYANNIWGESGTKYIQLLTDINKDNHTIWPLTFNSRTAIIDLNGKNIDRGLTEATPNGNVITVGVTLTIKDSSTTDVSNQGRITGGWNSDNTGGGVYVWNAGTGTLQGGNITGNKTTGDGGGVKTADWQCAFYMQGGSIAENQSSGNGGAVYAAGLFTMTGGSITDNQASGNGSVFGNTFSVGGTAVIKDNTVTGSGLVRNVVVTGNTIYLLSDTPLITGATIGVTANSAPTSGNPVDITGANSADYSG